MGSGVHPVFVILLFQFDFWNFWFLQGTLFPDCHDCSCRFVAARRVCQGNYWLKLQFCFIFLIISYLSNFVNFHLIIWWEGAYWLFKVVFFSRPYVICIERLAVSNFAIKFALNYWPYIKPSKLKNLTTGGFLEMQIWKSQSLEVFCIF